jgi:hypothetical protein
MRTLRNIVQAVVVFAAAGCGASSGNVPSDGGASRDGSASTDGAATLGLVTWKENGTARSATTATANRHTTTGADSLSVLAVDVPGQATVTFVVSGQTTLGGTYTCGIPPLGSTNVAALTYDNRMASTMDTCTITLTFTTGAGGQSHATGTFTAMLPREAGVTTLSDGQFDIPVRQN